MNIVYATENDLESILQLIRDRISWMDALNMKQWNTEDYLEWYQPSYFLKHIQSKEFLLLKQNENTLAAIGFFHDDEQWNHDPTFIYLHHLVADKNFKGAGRLLLSACEEEAKRIGKSGARLDCQEGNHKINAYYATRGYQYISRFVCDDTYTGIKREKHFDTKKRG